MSARLTPAQRRIAGGQRIRMFRWARPRRGARTRELLVGHGFIECDGVLHGGLLYKITDAGRRWVKLATPKDKS